MSFRQRTCALFGLSFTIEPRLGPSGLVNVTSVPHAVGSACFVVPRDYRDSVALLPSALTLDSGTFQVRSAVSTTLREAAAALPLEKMSVDCFPPCE